MRKAIRVLISIITALLCLFGNALSQDNEQSRLLNAELFGNFTNAKKIKKKGKVTLKLWTPYYEHAMRVSSSGIFSKKTLLGPGPMSLDVEYDEIWVLINDEGFSKAEKTKYKGQFDISKFYWNKGKVQAFTVEKYFISDPITNKKVKKHKIVKIYDRGNII